MAWKARSNSLLNFPFSRKGLIPFFSTRSLSTTRAWKGRPRNQRRGYSSISTMSVFSERCSASQAGVSRWIKSTLTPRTTGKDLSANVFSLREAARSKRLKTELPEDLAHLQGGRLPETGLKRPGRTKEIDLLVGQIRDQPKQGEQVRVAEEAADDGHAVETEQGRVQDFLPAPGLLLQGGEKGPLRKMGDQYQGKGKGELPRAEQ